jgi:hypothetical protein
MILEVLVRDMWQWRERWSVRFAGTTGPIDATIVWVDTDGDQRTLNAPIGIYTPVITPPDITTDDTDKCPCVFDADGNPVPVSTDTTPTGATPGRLTLSDGNWALNLDIPDTTATIWVMSDPQRLGTTTIAADGTIDTTYAIPTGIDPGNHTIQIDTVNTTGEPISIALGLTITSGLLPTTGTNTNTHLAWLTLIIAIGALTTLTATGNRRKQRPA